jgi:hypothetical protein
LEKEELNEKYLLGKGAGGKKFRTQTW